MNQKYFLAPSSLQMSFDHGHCLKTFLSLFDIAIDSLIDAIDAIDRFWIVAENLKLSPCV